MIFYFFFALFGLGLLREYRNHLLILEYEKINGKKYPYRIRQLLYRYFLILATVLFAGFSVAHYIGVFDLDRIIREAAK